MVYTTFGAHSSNYGTARPDNLAPFLWSTSTTLLVSPRAEHLDLLGLDEPEDEILEKPEQDLPMHGRQRAPWH
jgi:hypothetical protein